MQLSDLHEELLFVLAGAAMVVAVVLFVFFSAAQV